MQEAHGWLFLSCPVPLAPMSDTHLIFLLLAFCVWMLFSAVAVNLPKVGFKFTTDQLFMLTALPALSGALLRVPYAFMVPVFGGRRWTAFSTGIMIVPCVWLGFAVQDTSTPFSVFVMISLLCGFAGANFASSMANISFFFPKAKQGGALGINGGLGNMGVSVMQLIAPLAISVSIFAAFGGGGVEQADGSSLYLQNAAWIWVPFLVVFTLAAWFFMNDLSASKASLSEQLPVLKRGHLWVMALLYLATFGSFIGFSAGFAMLSKTQFPDVNILHLAFFGPLIGALARAGTDKSRLLTATIWLSDIANFAGMNAVWDAWVPAGTAPSRACVQVVRLAKPGWRVEIAVQAALRD